MRLVPLRGEKISAGLGDHPARLLQVGEEKVQDVAKAAAVLRTPWASCSHPFGRLDRRRSQPVLDFFDGVIHAIVDDQFVIDDRRVHGIRQSPSDSAARTRLDESVLRAGVEGVFPVVEFRVENNIPLLGGFCLEIGQALPRPQILRACDPAWAIADERSPRGAAGSFRSVQKRP